MCGIAGIVGHPRPEEAREIVQRMSAQLQHRGPDAAGIHHESAASFAHRRLSIIDLSEAGNQPMYDASGRYCIIHNGEIYNHAQIRDELPNYHFRSNTDTEVVLAAYLKWGADCLNKFEGMFATAIWDKEEKKLFLARDRMGIKPLYYFQKEKTLLFASEIRALIKSHVFEARLNENALATYLSYQTVYAPDTLVAGVKMLMPGHFMSFESGNLEIQDYWNLSEIQPETKLSYAAAKKKVHRLASEAVSKRLMSDVPLGTFLSGGIDSSAIVALTAQASTKTVDTFSVVFNEKEFDESLWSSQIAKKYNANHHPILLRPEQFLEELPNALGAMDFPSADGINSYVVSKVTKEQGITVALSGLGGDELFAGYPIFNQLPSIQNRIALWSLPTFLRKGIGKLVTASLAGRKGKQIGETLSAENKSLEELYPLFRRVYTENELSEILGIDKTQEVLLSKCLSALKLKNDYPILQQISIAEISTYTQNILLRDTDQMSMAHALEVRVPFFDYKLVEGVLSLPNEFKMPGIPKRLLVESLGELIPKEIVNRKKMGFTFPWEIWLKRELHDFCEARLRRLSQRRIFRKSKVMEKWNLFKNDDSEVIWPHIWLLVTLEEWLNRNGVSAE